MNRRFFFGRPAAAIWLAAVLLSGCGAEPAPASDFVLLDGSRLRTEQLLGKVTLVNFWATSCTTCVAEMPQLVRLHHAYHGMGFETLAVAMQYDPPAYVLHFSQSRKLPFKVALDHTGAIAREWGDVKLTPTTYVVNKRGHIVKRYVGEPDFVQLERLLVQLLAQT